MKSKWLEHQGKKIWYIDLSGFQSDVDAFRQELEAAAHVTMQQPENSLLVLTDLTETIVSTQAMLIAQNSSSDTQKHVRKTAVVGITGIRRYFLDTLSAFTGQTFETFDRTDDALAWLVQD